MDNLEHLLSAAPLISDLLGACPKLTVLATSREALRVREEQEFLVPPLALPAVGHDVPSVELPECASVELFEQRAAQRASDFKVTPASARTIADICRRLDGLPLAIELAAARTKLLSPTLLFERLEKRLTLLVDGARDLPARQRTLRDTIAWSYDLLAPGDQRLFRRLAVFAGGCTLGAAEALFDLDQDLDRSVLEGLASLVDKNLLQRADDPEGEPRFVMLETIREYALEQLMAVGEDLGASARHAAYFLALAESAERQVRGPLQLEWLARLAGTRQSARGAALVHRA